MLMKGRFFYLLTALAVAAVSFAGCRINNPDPENQTDPEDLLPLKLSVPVTGNWVYEDSQPSFTIHVENPNGQPLEARAKVRVATDKEVDVTESLATAEVPASGEKDVEVVVKDKLDPGFYKARCYVNDKQVRAFIFGVSPSKLVSAPDKQADFDAFWASTKEQLAAVDMKAELTEITTRSSASRKVYLVEIQSVPDGLTGDPVVVRGYYLEPQDGQKHPVIMHYFGYDDQKPKTKLSCPYGGSSQEFAEFYLSTRGQIINNRTAALREPDGKGDFVNAYGDWFAFNFGKRDAYYYRGAFMDCVQAIRFMATRPTSDMNNVFAEGSSQGGAFSYAAAALSDYPLRAIAPCVAFLGDFRITST